MHADGQILKIKLDRIRNAGIQRRCVGSYCVLAFFCIILTGQIAHFLSYALFTTANIIYHDYFGGHLFAFIENIYGNTFSIFDLFTTYHGISAIGANIIFIVNVVFFKLNTRFEIVLAAVSLTLLSITLFRYQVIGSMKSASLQQNTIIKMIASFFVVIIVFNLNQWENISNPSSCAHFVALVPFLLLLIVNEQILWARPQTSIKHWVVFTIILLTGLMFAAQYWMPFVAMITILNVFFFATKRRKPGLLIVAGILLISIRFVLQAKQYNGGDPIALIYAHPLESLQFLLLTFCGMNYGVRLFLDGGFMSIETGYVLGATTLLIYVAVPILYICTRKKNEEFPIVPVYCIAYAVGLALLYVYTRLFFSLEYKYVLYGMSSRYATHTMLGAIGVILIVFSLLQEYTHGRYQKFRAAALSAAVLFIVTGQVCTVIMEWKAAPGTRNYFLRLKSIGLSPEKYSDRELSLLSGGAKETKDGLALLKKHRLNIYSTQEAGKALHKEGKKAAP